MRAVRLCLPCPPPEPGKSWGDWFFARSLGRSFERAGIRVRFDFFSLRRRKGKWTWPTRWPIPGEVDLVIRGSRPYRPVMGRRLFIWLISQAETASEEELASARHVFVASQPYAEKLAAKGISASFLPQCTDAEIFRPRPPASELRSELLFVGNRRKYAPRPVVELARATGHELAVWGRGWEGILPENVFRGSAIENDDLSGHYASARVVLNDHTEGMRKEGFLSNRAYDVLASARPILTEKMPGIPVDLQEALYLYTPETFTEVLERALAEADQDREEMANYVRSNHDFSNRAARIVEVATNV
ncbi:hypothetical protein SAMN05421688_3439 [Poseidonocella pacifica]|uniref:Spore protein YkvP/CgeB glycosyl transferase-like domain-containing protein n=1 Tax=Poseidonocella pacifica TaxID=871651 RepID=A0A1I0YX27_9RHOB|nr:hypothetical protein [Poseidonocella pacifica]SFB17831.1 hypothetical protein SAMN05421688_3439 [Poseidonocella pacifica]